MPSRATNKAGKGDGESQWLERGYNFRVIREDFTDKVHLERPKRGEGEH